MFARCHILFTFLFTFTHRSKMPEKTDEERERIAKKLAEQRAKIEGMPTTAKVDILSDIMLYSREYIFSQL